jgi:DNA-binding NarL/FixJ family response regulator
LEKIRILLEDTPCVLVAQLKNLIECQADMEVVGEVATPIELLLAVPETRAQVVILASGMSEEQPGVASHLLSEYPDVLIVCVSSATKGGSLYQRRLLKKDLPGASVEQILAAIRSAAAETEQ